MGFFSSIGSAIGGFRNSSKKPDDFDEIEQFCQDLEKEIKKENKKEPDSCSGSEDDMEILKEALEKNLSPKELVELMRKKK